MSPGRQQDDSARSHARLLRRRIAWSWLGIVAAPLLFLLNLQVTYALTGPACRDAGLPFITLHLTSAVLAATAAVLGVIAWRQRGPESPQDPEGNTAADWSHLLAVLGALGGGFFALLILAQWLPTFMLHPCLRPM